MPKKIKFCPIVLYQAERYDKKFSRWDAVGQEITFLKGKFGGLVFALTTEVSRKLNMHRLVFKLPFLFEKNYFSKIFWLEKRVDLHHIYYPRLRNFRYLAYLKKPIIYTVVSKNMGFSSQTEMVKEVRNMSHIAYFIVATPEDESTLKKAGVKNVRCVLPGLNIQRFSGKQKKDRCHNLLMATPPTGVSRFRNRGMNLILKTWQNLQNVTVTFLWRGIAYKEMMNKIADCGVGKKVSVINKLVDPKAYLAKADGSIAVFVGTEGNKAYPNSIIESLAAGKPVIVSSIMPIAELVKKFKCGVVVKPNTVSLRRGVSRYYGEYDQMAKNCKRAARVFSLERLLSDYQKIYREVLK